MLRLASSVSSCAILPSPPVAWVSRWGVITVDNQISVRTMVLLLVGGFTVYVAMRDPELGVAVGVGVVVVALLHQLLGR